MTLRRRKPDPRPLVFNALARQYWSSAAQIAAITKLPQSKVSAILRKFWETGFADRQMDGTGKMVYRRRRGET